MLDMQASGSSAAKAITFPAGDAQLQGRLFLPLAAPKAAVVINSAAGVPQGYYRAFATWLAEQNDMAVLTFDYRDFGKSAAQDVRQSKVLMSDWALTDQPAARDEMRRQLPQVPLWVIGHSLGAMLMPLQRDVDVIDRMIGVTSGLVYHRDHPWPYQALTRMFWFGHAPLAVRAMGYLPGWVSGFGVDLPASVYWEWRRWCTSPAAYYPEMGSTLPKPNWPRDGQMVDLIALVDDPVAPVASVRKLKGLYGERQTNLRVLDPADYGLKKVGHLGAFARKNRAIWPTLIDGGRAADS